MLVPVYAFPRPVQTLATFVGRFGNLIEHVMWLVIGMYGAVLRNRMRQRYSLPHLPLFGQLGLRGSPVEAHAWILQNTVFGLDLPR
jgi:hypothetical protein